MTTTKGKKQVKAPTNKEITSINDIMKIIKKEKKPQEKVTFKSMEEVISAIKGATPKTDNGKTVPSKTDNEIHKTLNEAFEVLKTMQNDILEIKTNKFSKPSKELTTFFKKYKIDVTSFPKMLLNRELDGLKDNLKDENYIKKLVEVKKSNDEELKNKFKKYKALLSETFVDELKSLELADKDILIMIGILGDLSSFISSVKYYIPKETGETAK